MTDRVGILSPFVGGDYWGAIIAGITQAAVGAGRSVLAIQTLSPGAFSSDQSGVPDFSRPVGWDLMVGLIVLPGAVRPDYVRRAQAAGKAVVLISHDLPGVRCPQVVPDNRGGVREVVAHLVGHGHREIAFAGYLDSSDIRERHDGYREGLAEHGLPDRPDLLFAVGDNHESGGLEIAEQLLRAGLPATAVVTGTDRNAISMMGRLEAAGVDLPGRLAVVGFDDIADARFVVPGLSTVSQPLDRLGGLAFELLSEAVAGRPVGDVGRAVGDRHLVATRFVRRTSCGCPDPGLETTDAQVRQQFEANLALQTTMNTQYELAVELLRTGEESPRELAWLGRTQALGGCLGLWSDDSDPADAVATDPADPAVDVVGAYQAGIEAGTTLPVSAFPPPGLLALENGPAGDITFVVPVRTQLRDWGVLAAVSRIQETTPAGREMMNHSGALLGVALDHETLLRSLFDQEERLRRAALYDQLTGLPNRALLFDRLENARHRSARHPEHQFALLFLDLDGFKAVNDTLGHAAGDRLLVEVAQRLSRVVRESDTVARIGGDEFVVLLDGLPVPHGPQPAIDRIEQLFTEPVLIDGQTATVGASIGLALSGDGFVDAEDLLRHADAAMYAAKLARKPRAEAG